MNDRVLFIKAFLEALKRGGFRGVVNNPRSILIVYFGKLGDMVCVTPVFRAIKSKYKEAEITLIGSSLNRELLAHNEDIDNYISFDGDYISLINILKKNKYDVGISIGPNSVALSILFLSGVKVAITPFVVGNSPRETLSYRILKKMALTFEHRMNEYAPREYLKLLQPLGIISTETRKFLYYSKDDEKQASYFIKQGGINMGVVVSAGNKIKEWPPEKFSRIIEYLVREKKATVYIIGGPSDGEISKEVIRNISEMENVYDVTGKLTIGALKAFISKLDMLIGVDTGPIYIAEAFGVKTVDIIGPMSEVEQPPVGKGHKIVYDKNRKSPELHIMNARVYNSDEAKRQVSVIEVEDVINAINECLYD